MPRVLSIHPVNPQPRLIAQAVAALHQGQLLAYPTDSSYALGCRIEDKAAEERMRRARRLDASHELTLVCRDLSEVAAYAKVDNPAYRLMRALTPGPYTFILEASREVPRRLQNRRRRTIGLRVPDHPIAQGLLAALGEPLMTTTMQLPGDDLPLAEPELFRDRLEGQVEVILDGGGGGVELTTLIDLTAEVPEVLRQGVGEFG